MKKKHFGVLAGDGSHLKVMLAVAKTLEDRGYRITFFHTLDNKKRILDQGFEFVSYGKVEFPIGTLNKQNECINNLMGYSVLEKVCTMYLEQISVIIEQLPILLQRESIDILIVDAVFPEGGTVADILGIPFININAGLITHQELGIPCGWDFLPFSKSITGYIQNFFSYQHINRIYFTPRLKLINQYRKKFGLKRFNHFEDCFSNIVQLTQEYKEFEFPRKKLPSNIHFVGLIDYNQQVRDKQQQCKIQLNCIETSPIVFASLGTLLNNNYQIYEKIADVCEKLKVQLIIGLGGARVDSLPALKGNPIVMQYAPQKELLSQVDVFITHAGLNSTNEAIQAGVPMIAIPLSFEQPGIARRIEWHGIGKVILPNELDESMLYNTLVEMLNNKRYLKNVKNLSDIAKEYRGADDAVTIIENAFDKSWV